MSTPAFVIATHAGSFHADELMALALLDRFYLKHKISIPKGLSPMEVEQILKGDLAMDERTYVVRTRSAQFLALARENPRAFVIDVGGELDRARLNFDHHQGSMTESWADGTPLSSTGLIWLWLKEQGHLATLSAPMIQALEEELVIPLDAHDNGQKICELGMTVDAFNRNSVEPDVQVGQFKKAFSFMRDMLANYEYRIGVKLEATAVLSQAWEQAQARGDAHVVLNTPLAYTDGTGLLKEISNDQAELLAIPGQGTRYSLISVPGNEGRFSTKCPMPQEWRGQMDTQLEIEGRTIDLAFAHKTGFMCVIDGSAQDVHAVARHVVAHNHMLRASNPSPRPR